MDMADRVRAVVVPLAEAASLDLYDVEHHGAMVRVLVDAEGGIDLDRIARFSRSVSRALDEHDPIAGQYTLEVSSPGLERPLRTPEHFRRAVGTRIKLKTHPSYAGPRRLSGLLEAVSSSGVQLRDDDGLMCIIDHAEIVSARTVFDWKPPTRPKSSGHQKSAAVGETTADRVSVVSSDKEADTTDAADNSKAPAIAPSGKAVQADQADHEDQDDQDDQSDKDDRVDKEDRVDNDDREDHEGKEEGETTS